MNSLKRLVLLFFIVNASTVYAQNDAVFKITIDKALEKVYTSVYESLEEARFFVVFEPDIGSNLARFSERWGDDYNKNDLTALRSMVFCNAWYANKVSNLDPDLLGLCPLHISLYEKQGVTTILFNRPSTISKNSPAHALIKEIEEQVIEAIIKGAR